MEVDSALNVDKDQRVHLMGIGGAGVSGLAILLKQMGAQVSGCDMARTFYVNRVEQQKIKVTLEHHPNHLDIYKPDLLIYTSAIPDDHAEIVEARRRGIAVAKRGEVLSWFFNKRSGVGVAGTHGKTTTSSMISLIAEQANCSPTVAIGGELSDIGCNAKLGSGDFMVAELDESDGSFELFNPEIAVVTNIDWDHMDHYPSYDLVLEAFERFVRGRKDGGACIVCAEDAGVLKLLERVRPCDDFITYGWGTGWDWGATEVCHVLGGGVAYMVNHKGRKVGKVVLSVSGEHNVLNSLAAIAASSLMGIPFDCAVGALRSFTGAQRRLQLVDEVGSVLIYDDYAHHPNEIHATLSTLRKIFPHRRIVVAFQPHRYTRTEAMYGQFAAALCQADRIYLLPVYSADEKPIAGVSSQLIADAVRECDRPRFVLCDSFGDVLSCISLDATDDDLIITIGAGSVGGLGRKIAERIADTADHQQIAVGS